MHPAATRNEFLRLRVQGLSLARIGRRLGVSKPTLIAWNRQSRADIASRAQADQQRVEQEVSTSTSQELSALSRRLTALKQELFSRAMREFPTSALEILAGEIRQRIEKLSGVSPPSVGAQALACSNPVPPPVPAAQQLSATATGAVGLRPSPGTATTEAQLPGSGGAQASACSNSVLSPEPAAQPSTAEATPHQSPSTPADDVSHPCPSVSICA